eukprot:TRINITY_DN4563_c0_g2_i1.p1 TRINITY_DN4563_c0_g2~~TRINITY_DN4563_c0_g2_i1.p1  ORF type:complete len:596 (+),score=93.99 TRINITY_DN4563_c0_g2_i1:167-1954(+)
MASCGASFVACSGQPFLPSRPFLCNNLHSAGFRPSFRSFLVRAQGKSNQLTADHQALVQECIQKLSYSTGVHRSNPNQHFRVTGEQHTLGLNGQWTLCWCMDGRFYEKFDSNEMTYEYGYDGHSSIWHADFAGRVTPAELDDDEVTKLSLFFRTGFWLTEKGQDLLNITLEGENDVKAVKQQIGAVAFLIHFKNKKVVAHLLVDACKWLPLSMEMKALGQTERWEYKDWRSIDDSFRHKFPHFCIHYPLGGGKDSFTVLHSSMHAECDKMEKENAVLEFLYAYPTTRVIPRYNKDYPRTSLDVASSPNVKLIRATTGQLLVKALVDGTDIGYFVLDSGAGGLAICPEKANELSMDSFGDVFVTGFHGQVQSRFRRGKLFQLGPLKIESPIFVEVDMKPLVVGRYFAIGICGFDILQHCIVEISCAEERVSFFDNTKWKEMSSSSIKWETLSFIQNVPNIPVKINGQNSLLLLDTGASGVDVIFHSKADKYAGEQVERFADIRGVNYSQGELEQVYRARIDRMDIAGHSLENVDAIYLSAASSKLQFSEYTSGVLCMELLRRFILVLNYPERRAALININGRQYQGMDKDESIQHS